MQISRISFPLAVPFLVLLASCPTRAQGPPAQTRVVITHEMPAFDGSQLRVTGVEVTYPPRGSSPPHTHGCPVVGYIAEGAIRYQVKGQPGTIYKAGDSFYEAANGVHQVSANASDKEPARLIVFFLCDHQAPLSTTLPADSTGGKKP